MALGWLLAAWLAVVSEASGAGCEGEESALLTLRSAALRAGGGEPFTLAGKSIYFMVLDRFAKSGEEAKDTSFCSKTADWTYNTGGGYCGGTIQGITEKLDYIQGMGFDCVWITPVVHSNSYMGYDAHNLFEINPSFGTKEDLQQLSDSLHERNMCLVVDIVLNHMRSLFVNQKLNISSVVPFNDPSYYHQRDRKEGQSFEDYVKSGPPPAFDGSKDSRNLKELTEKGHARCGPENWEQTECACFPGNSGVNCPSYNAQQQVEGWFGSLGDLNHSHPFVREQLLKYVSGLVKDYHIDGFRLDTAIYIDKGFLSEVQDAAGVEILGEATVNNLTYQSFLMRGEREERVLSGLLNFPPFYQVPEAFCGYIMGGDFGDYSAQGTWKKRPNMKGLGLVMSNQQDSAYENSDLLGNFVDNHDEFARIAHYCKFDQQRIRHALTWVMFTQGIPIVYYGTEQSLSGHQTKVNNPGQDALRESMWQTGYDTTAPLYRFLAQLNKVRKSLQMGTGESDVKNYDSHSMIFTRDAKGGQKAWVFVNNMANSTAGGIRYCPGPLPGIEGQAWHNALSGASMERHLADGCFEAPDQEPKVLHLQQMEEGRGQTG
ncbi:unnamed protein product [Effrenium voratum]|nr:unnamed protein product [Effrenium voratum]CAJ1440476.1 unnamed protein product [Effrenium voratum]